MRSSGTIHDGALRGEAGSRAVGDDVDCTGSYELEGTRVADVSSDECFDDDDCVNAGGMCNDGLGLCMPPGPAGSACFFDDDCVSDSCNSATGRCN